MTASLSQDNIDPVNTSNFSIDNAYVDWLDASGNVLRHVYVDADSSHAAHIGVEAPAS